MSHFRAGRRFSYVISGLMMLLCVAEAAVLTDGLHDSHLQTNISLAQSLAFTLSMNPSILVQSEAVESERGSFIESIGILDPIIDTHVEHTHTPYPLLQSDGEFDFNGHWITVNHEDNTRWALGYLNTLSNGIQFGPELILTREDTTFKHLAQIPPENRANVGFNLFVPLMKGSAIGLEVDSAFEFYQQQIHTARHNVAVQTLSAITAYWNVVSSEEAIRIRTDARNDSQKLVNSYKVLIAADEKPAADMKLAVANLSDYEVSLIQARQTNVVNLSDLGRLMGIDPHKAMKIEHTTTPFPAIEAKYGELIHNLDKYMASALIKREDYLALQSAIAANALLVKKNKVDLGPQLNVTGRLGYYGLHEGDNFFRSLSDNIRAPSAFASINYIFPVGNHAASGNLMQSQAAMNQAIIRQAELARNILLDIRVSAYEINRAIGQVKAGEESVANYAVAIQNTRRQLREGDVTLNDLIQVQNGYNSARLSLVDAKFAYAVAIARFKFNVGS